MGGGQQASNSAEASGACTARGLKARNVPMHAPLEPWVPNAKSERSRFGRLPLGSVENCATVANYAHLTRLTGPACGCAAYCTCPPQQAQTDSRMLANRNAQRVGGAQRGAAPAVKAFRPGKAPQIAAPGLLQAAMMGSLAQLSHASPCVLRVCAAAPHRRGSAVAVKAQKKEIMMWEALREATDEEMTRDPNVCVMGECVGWHHVRPGHDGFILPALICPATGFCSSQSLWACGSCKIRAHLVWIGCVWGWGPAVKPAQFSVRGVLGRVILCWRASQLGPAGRGPAGEDVGHYGGSYKVTLGLYKKFGDLRVLDTPICGACADRATPAAMAIHPAERGNCDNHPPLVTALPLRRPFSEAQLHRGCAPFNACVHHHSSPPCMHCMCTIEGTAPASGRTVPSPITMRMCAHHVVLPPAMPTLPTAACARERPPGDVCFALSLRAAVR